MHNQLVEPLQIHFPLFSVDSELATSPPLLSGTLQDVILLQIKRKVVVDDVGVKSLHKYLHVAEEVRDGGLPGPS